MYRLGEVEDVVIPIAIRIDNVVRQAITEIQTVTAQHW